MGRRLQLLRHCGEALRDSIGPAAPPRVRRVPPSQAVEEPRPRPWRTCGWLLQGEKFLSRQAPAFDSAKVGRRLQPSVLQHAVLAASAWFSVFSKHVGPRGSCGGPILAKVGRSQIFWASDLNGFLACGFVSYDKYSTFFFTPSSNSGFPLSGF
jgi:hypothetical protein